jgi:hypothetical protein
MDGWRDDGIVLLRRQADIPVYRTYAFSGFLWRDEVRSVRRVAQAALYPEVGPRSMRGANILLCETSPKPHMQKSTSERKEGRKQRSRNAPRATHLSLDTRAMRPGIRTT